MAKLKLTSENIEIDVKPGTFLKDAIEKAGSRFPFGCQRGSCGTCRCFVLSGMENLNPKTQAEEFLFTTLTAVEDHERLGCQLIIQGDVEIEV